MWGWFCPERNNNKMANIFGRMLLSKLDIDNPSSLGSLPTNVMILIQIVKGLRYSTYGENFYDTGDHVFNVIKKCYQATNFLLYRL